MVSDSPGIQSDPSGITLPRTTPLKLSIAVPFFLAAALYLSVLFAVFSMLPLIYCHMRLGRFWGVVCSLTNVAIVWALCGRSNAALFFMLAAVPGVVITECIRLKLKIDVTALLAVLMMIFISAVLLAGYSLQFQINPLTKLQSFISELVDQVVLNIEKYKASGAISSQDIERFLLDPEMTKKSILFELPSAATITLILTVVANLLLMVRLNLSRVRDVFNVSPTFFKHWHAPDHLIWPTLATGVFLVFEVPVVSEIALNLFKVFMTIYALQGLAITNFIFDAWGVKGILRPLGYALSIALLLPLVISLGFFDLWFGFRERFKVPE